MKNKTMRNHDFHSNFHTTHWSVVLAAKGNETAAGVALRELCETYYGPVLHYIERAVSRDSVKIYGGRDAQDLTHDFFSRLLETNMFEHVSRSKGTFRSYLLGAVRHFLAKIREQESAAKRGGDFTQTLLHDNIPDENSNEEAVFDRDWAQTTIRLTLDSLGKTPESQALLPWITREMDAAARTELSEKFGMSEVAVKVALHRLRKRFREAIRTRIAETVENPSEIDAELDYLIKILRTV